MRLSQIAGQPKAKLHPHRLTKLTKTWGNGEGYLYKEVNGEEQEIPVGFAFDYSLGSRDITDPNHPGVGPGEQPHAEVTSVWNMGGGELNLDMIDTNNDDVLMMVQDYSQD